MIKRTIYFGNPAKLRKKDEQLQIDYLYNKEVKHVPVEDVGLLIVDHPQVSVTHNLMNALVNNNAAILWCDEQHLPNGLVLPMSSNHIYTEKLRSQLNASQPLKKQLWKQTVKTKIRNQATVLDYAGLPKENMHHWADHVGSGDPKNLEGRASAYYWKVIFDHLDQHFTRDPLGDPPNNMLNYGYAILRAVVARSLVASGCLPAIGIHHKNKYNAFCLADDIMEPYRPFVDRLVLDIVQEMDVEELPLTLDKELKAKFLQIPTIDITIDDEKSPLMVGMQRTTASLMNCFEQTSRKILYPEL